MNLTQTLSCAFAALSLSFAALAADKPAAAAADDLHPRVQLDTSEGPIIVELDREHAPISTANFLSYVAEGHYDGTIFHRVIRGFVIQGGGYDASLNQKATHAPIKLEASNGLKNARGTLSMARTSDPDSATSQFYVNLVDNRMLDARPGNDGYTVFGKVVEGMNVVDRIAAHATVTNPAFGPDVPRETVTLTKAKLLTAKP